MKISLIIAAITALESTAAADPPTAEDSTSSTPESLYTEGQTAYDRTDYATAIARWHAAYELSGEPSLLFDVAQAQRLSGDCSAALETYEHFVAIDPDPTSGQHALAEDLSRELATRCGAGPDPAPSDQAQRLNLVGGLSRSKDDGQALRIVGLATSGAGALTLTIGLGLGHHGQTLGDEVTRACTTSCDWSAQKSKDAAGRSDVAAGRALDALGGVALVGGAVACYFGYRESSLAITPRPSDGGAVVTWSGSW